MAKFLSQDGLTTFWNGLKGKFLRTDVSISEGDNTTVLENNAPALANLGLSATNLSGLLEKLGVHVGTGDPAEVDTSNWNEGDLYIWVNSN